ncbi:MAG TPA: exodeoxyribonuclease VII small subunit [Acidobacteriota bacterium]|nr:exodeoxyribonuclease VII small subunit [Acidobacteriota bacterium]
MKYKQFEEALGRLEEIVDELEKGEASLEQSLKLFEEGIQISHFCGEKLDEAERKVEVLLRKGGKDVEEPFQVSEEEDS